MSTLTRRIAAGALLLGPAVHLTAEAVSAAAWKEPAYSCTTNSISDLGSTTQGLFQGREVDSPLHDVMNLGIISQGALFIAGTLLLARIVPRQLRVVTTVLGVIAGLGYLLLGLFHGSATAADDGTLAWHFTGAALAILGADALALILGLHWWRDPEMRRLGHASAPLGAIGFLAAVLLMTTMGTDAPSGLIERIAVYPILLWQIRVALELLLRPAGPPRVAARLIGPMPGRLSAPVRPGRSVGNPGR